MNFKIGDKVKYVGKVYKVRGDDEGVITDVKSVSSDWFPYMVLFPEESFPLRCTGKELELVVKKSAIPDTEKWIGINGEYFNFTELREIWTHLQQKALNVQFGIDVLSPADKFAYYLLKPIHSRFTNYQQNDDGADD